MDEMYVPPPARKRNQPRSWLALIHAVIEVLTVCLLTVMIAVTVYQVFMRSVVNRPTSWSEELALLMMIWFGYLGMVLGIRENVHISIEFLYERLPAPVQWILDFVNHVAMAIFGFFMLVEGIALSRLTRAPRMPAIRVSRAWMYIVLIIAGALMMLFVTEQFVLITRRYRENRLSKGVTP